jgi:tRNA (cytidine56-2'-O)-methyltransferase
MIVVLRLGHRISRDKRITTHVFLTARALGADEGVLCGEKDELIIDSVRKISSKWGGNFQVEYVEDWKKYIENAKAEGFKVVHLTMYGIQIQKIVSKIKSNKILIIVGGEKVPPEVYQLADFNIAVTSQPHSEVAALALFLEKHFKGKELEKKFDGEIKIVPCEKGKRFA